MTIAGKLAKTFVKAAHEKQAEAQAAVPRYFSLEDIPGAEGADKEGLRQEFEQSLSKEEILRRKAMEYARLARIRAEDQPGAGGEFFKRLAPVPYTGSEAAWRLPAIAAAGAGGYVGLPWLLGEGTTPANADLVARVMQQNILQGPGGQQRTVVPLLEQLAAHLNQAQLAPAVEAELRHLPAEALAQLVGRGQVTNPQAQAALAAFAGMPHSGATREALQEAYLRAASGMTSGRDAAQLFRAPRSWPYWVGGAGGLAAGSILTGLPMAIRAGALRRTGGELSHNARSRMRKAIEKAEREQFRRENIVRMMQGDTPLPLDEWKQRKHQMRTDWRSSAKEYRELARARKKGRRSHGVSAPPVEEEAK